MARLMGHVDRVDGLLLAGWALDTEDLAARPLVQVVQGGVVVAITRPRLPLPALRASLGLPVEGPPPLHGWQVALPLGNGIAPDRPFEVLIGAERVPAGGGTGCVIPALGGLDPEVAQDLAAPLSQITVGVHAGHVAITARAVQSDPPCDLQLAVGKGPPRRLSLRPLPPASPFLRPGLLFETRLARGRIEAMPNPALPIRLRFPGDDADTRLNGHHALRAIWLPRDLFEAPAGALPTPPDALLQRSGVPGASREAYRIGGLTAFMQLDLLARRHAGRRLARFPAVLDWGVGCARVLRHFAATGTGPEVVTSQRLVGIDEDAAAIAWCRAALGGVAEFAEPRGAAFDLPAESIDLLYGIDQMTRLAERDQLRWLAEIRRVLKPGGLAILTLHGEVAAALDLSGFASGFVARFGAFDGVPGRAADAGRTSFHSRAYLRRVWGEAFEILDIAPATNGFLQDFVVLKRPE